MHPQTSFAQNSTNFTVLGGSGFIGSNLVNYIKKQGYSCNAPLRDDVSIYGKPLGHIVYAIGLTADFRTRPLDTVEAHVCILRKLLAEAEFESLTYLSSARFYRYAQSTSEQTSFSMDPARFDSIYDLSKLMGESMCLHSGRTNIKIARLSNVVGLRNDCDIFIDQVLNDIVNKGSILLKDSIEASKDYISIEDISPILTKVSLSPETGCFNIASGENTSNLEILNFLKSEFSFDFLGSGSGDPTNLPAIDISRAHRLFEFTPTPFEKFFPNYLVQFKENRRITV
jgi:nucleoside-diphosphate-sugar epimerase